MLAGANLTRARLVGTDLGGAILEGATLPSDNGCFMLCDDDTRWPTEPYTHYHYVFSLPESARRSLTQLPHYAHKNGISVSAEMRWDAPIYYLRWCSRGTELTVQIALGIQGEFRGLNVILNARDRIVGIPFLHGGWRWRSFGLVPLESSWETFREKLDEIRTFAERFRG